MDIASSQPDQPRQLVVIWTTVSGEEDAQRLAAGLIEARLAACVQTDSVSTSVYRWRTSPEGDETVCRDAEVRLWVKTFADRVAAVEAFFVDHHPYELPQMVVVTATASDAYRRWADASA